MKNIFVGLFLVASVSANAQPSSIEKFITLKGKLPVGYKLNIESSFYPSVKSEDLGLIKKSKCFSWSIGDIGGGTSGPGWTPLKKSIEVFTQSNREGVYEAQIPFMHKDSSCKYKLTGITLSFGPINSEYSPIGYGIILPFNPNDPYHIEPRENEENALECRDYGNGRLSDCISKVKHLRSHHDSSGTVLIKFENIKNEIKLDIYKK